MSINQNKNHKENLSPKRLVYTAPSGNTGATSRAGSAETPTAPSAAPTPAPTISASNDIIRLQQLLEGERAQSQEAARRLMTILEADTSLEALYQQAAQQGQSVSQPRVQQTPAGSSTENLQQGVMNSLSRVGNFFQETFGRLTGLQMSPAQKAIEHKKAIVDRINQLLAGGRISVSETQLGELRGRINARYAETLNATPHLTKENGVVIAAALGVLLFNTVRKKSLWEGFKSTAKLGLYVGGAGLAVYGIKTAFPNTKAGEYADKAWDRFFVHMPGVTQYQQSLDRQRTTPVASPEVREVASVRGMVNLIREYRLSSNQVTVTNRGVVRGREQVARELNRGLIWLKENGSQRVKEALANVTMSASPTPEELNLLEAALGQAEANDFYNGRVPETVRGVMRERDQLRQGLDNRHDDVPRSSERGAVNEAFASTVNNRAEQTKRKIDRVKSEHMDFFTKMRRTVAYWTEQQSQIATEAQLVRRQLEGQRSQQVTNPQLLQTRLASLEGILNNINRWQSSYNQALQSSPEQMYETLKTNIETKKNELLAPHQGNRPNGLQGRREKFEAFYDQVLGFEIIAAESMRLPDDVTNPTVLEQVSVGFLGYMAITAMGMASLTVARAGALAVRGGVRLAATPFGLARRIGAGRMAYPAHQLPNAMRMDRMFATGSAMVAMAAFGLMTINLRDAYVNFRIAATGVDGFSRMERGLSGATSLSMAVMEAGVMRRTLVQFTQLTLREPGRLYWRRLGSLGFSTAILAGIEVAGTRLRATLEESAAASELEDLNLRSFSSTDLLGLFGLYSTDMREDIISGLCGWAGIGEIPDANRQRMRVKILQEFGRRNGLNESQQADMMSYFREFSSGRNQVEFKNDDDQQILVYSIYYAQLKSLNLPSTDFDSSLEGQSQASMKQRIDTARARVEYGLRANQMRARLNVETVISPETRFMLRSMRGYEDVVRFYQLCLIAKRNTSDAGQREILDRYIRETTVYMTAVHGGYNGGIRPLSRDEMAGVTFQRVQDFLTEEINVPPERNQLLHYYGNDFILSKLSNNDPFTPTDATKTELIAHLRARRVSQANAQSFANLFLDGYTFRKRAGDELIQREKNSTREAFIAGQWRQVEHTGTESQWEILRYDGYQAMRRRVDGVDYYYLPSFNVFLLEEPPSSRTAFAGRIDGSQGYIPPTFNLNEKGLTSADIPVAIIRGLSSRLTELNRAN